MNETIIRCICDKQLSEVSNMFKLSNGDYVCSKKCLFKYSWRYFAIQIIKGRSLILDKDWIKINNLEGLKCQDIKN